MDILISIKPKYVTLIKQSIKKVELRRKFRTDTIDKIYIYESSPTKLITSYFIPSKIIRLEINNLFDMTSKISGISENQFRRYFSNANYGYGIFIKEFKPIHHISLNLLKRRTAPQNYFVLTPEESYILNQNIGLDYNYKNVP